MAAIAAAAAFHLFVAGHAAEFERLGDVLIYRLLHLMEVLLGFDEASRDRIRHERVAFLFVFGDFFAGKLHALLLLVLQVLPFFSEIAIKLLGAVVREERIDLAAQTQVTGILQNRFAKFPRLLIHQTLLSNSSRHNVQRCSGAPMLSSITEWRLPVWARWANLFGVARDYILRMIEQLATMIAALI